MSRDTRELCPELRHLSEPSDSHRDLDSVGDVERPRPKALSLLGTPVRARDPRVKARARCAPGRWIGPMV